MIFHQMINVGEIIMVLSVSTGDLGVAGTENNSWIEMKLIFSRSSRTFGSLRSAPIPQHDTIRKKTQPSPEIGILTSISGQLPVDFQLTYLYSDMYEYDAGYSYGDHHQSFNSNVYLIDHDPKKSQFIWWLINHES